MGKKSKAKNQALLDEIKKEVSVSSNISKECKYAMGMLGISYQQIKELKMDDFEGDDEEKQIQFDFYNLQRDKLLFEIIECKQKVIDQRLCDEQALAEEEEEHLKQLLVDEDKKLQKIFNRQDRETKRLLNEQLSAMDQHEKQRQLKLIEKEKVQRKQEELNKILQEKEKKKQQIMERRKKAEELQREQEKQRYLEALKKRQENDKKLAEEQAKRERHRQNLLHKRIKEFHTKRIEKIKTEELLDAQQIGKMHEIETRYNTENNRYVSTIRSRMKSVHTSYEKRRKRHEKNYNKYLKEVRDKHQALLNKQKADEKRLKQFQENKEKELKRKKLERENKIRKTLCAAKGGEEQRLKQIEDDAKRAAENRAKFFAKKAREDYLKRLVAQLKKQAAIDATERNARAKDFKNHQLLQKNEREDLRRMKDLTLKETLRQQRMMNDTSAKLRQEQLKLEIMEANKNGDITKLKRLVNELENNPTTTTGHTINASPIKGKPNGGIENNKNKKGKVNIMMSPRDLDSSIVKTIKVQESKIKANIYRGTQ